MSRDHESVLKKKCDKCKRYREVDCGDWGLMRKGQSKVKSEMENLKGEKATYLKLFMSDMFTFLDEMLLLTKYSFKIQGPAEFCFVNLSNCV